MTKVYAGIGEDLTVELNAFNGCTSLTDIYIRERGKDELKEIVGYDTKWGAPEDTNLYYVDNDEKYMNSMNNEYNIDNFTKFTD